MSGLKYKYSLLKYRHSAFLGESINIGVLFYFPVENQLHFRFSKSLKRIKAIYKLNSEKILKHYLVQINKKIYNSNFIKGIEFQTSLFEFDFDEFIAEKILPRDSSSIYFSDSKTTRSKITEIDKVINFFAERFLNEKFEVGKKVLKENSFFDSFYKSIDNRFDLNKIYEEKKFYKNYEVINENGYSYTFEYGWQNGTLNLMKPLNLNIQKPKEILNKSYKYFGLLTDLKDEAEKDNLRYDLVIAKPENKEFHKEFDHALKVLDTLDRVELILEDEIKKYTKRAIKALRS